MTDRERNAVTNAVTDGVTNGVSNATQTRPIPVVISDEITTGENLSSSPISQRDEIDLQAEAELETERAQARLERYLTRRPPRFAAPGILPPELTAWLGSFAEGDLGNLVLTGNTGTGKSWSVWRIGEELLRAGYPGRIEITTAYRLKELAAPPTDTEELGRLATADLLALDDVGAIRVSDWDADHLYALIDERWAHQRPTIVVTNTTRPREDGKTALEALLGPRVASRIADGVTVVAITGQDRRRNR